MSIQITPCCRENGDFPQVTPEVPANYGRWGVYWVRVKLVFRD